MEWCDLASIFYKLMRKHIVLDSAIQQIWKLDSMGGLYFMRILILFLLSFMLGSAGVVHPSEMFGRLYQAGGVLFAVCGCLLLRDVVRVSALFRDRLSGSDSIIAAVGAIPLSWNPA